jgi:hypothetical protein
VTSPANSGHPSAAASDGQRDAASGRFLPGNRGRPPGTKHRLTKALDGPLNEAGEAIVRKVIELALVGDVGALRLCLDRIFPVPKGRTVHIDLPVLKTARDALEAKAQVVEAAAAGEIDLEQAGELARLVDGYAEAHRLIALEERLASLEARLAQREPA